MQSKSNSAFGVLAFGSFLGTIFSLVLALKLHWGFWPVIPGMMAQVDILTGKKTVLSYLLKPVLRAKANALTER